MRVQKRLLRGLMDFAAGDPIDECLSVGVHRDADGVPVLYVPSFPVMETTTWTQMRKDVRAWLATACAGSDSLVSCLTPHLRTELFMPIPRRRGPLGRPRTWHGQLVLRTDTTVASWAIAVLALACCTPTGEDDCLANRIAHCEMCGRYFILPTSRPSRACSTECRKVSRRKAA